MLYAVAAAARILETLELFASLGWPVRSPSFIPQLNRHDIRRNETTSEDDMNNKLQNSAAQDAHSSSAGIMESLLDQPERTEPTPPGASGKFTAPPSPEPPANIQQLAWQRPQRSGAWHAYHYVIRYITMLHPFPNLSDCDSNIG